ncbi:protein tiptop-like [Hetaerina americana]|uniref:protein tiptop-like n=1 Tax=Hetaerina americana TaxID=62018 RepID=UPI003A7F5FB4
MLGPAATILTTPPAVMLNPSAAATILGSVPGVLSASRPVVQVESGNSGNAEILDFSTKGRKRCRRRDGGRDSGEDVDSEEDAESDMDQESIEEEGGVLNLSKPTTPQVATLDLSSPLDLSVNRRKRQRLASSEDISVSTVPGTASQTPQNLHVGASTPTTSMSPLASLASSIASHLLPHRRSSQQGRSEGFKQPPTPWSTGATPVQTAQTLPYPFYQSSKSAQTHHHHHQTPTTQSNSLRQSSPDPWNGKVKGSMTSSPGYNMSSSVAPSDASKALEKMSELSKLGSDSVRDDAAALSYLRQHQSTGAGSTGGGSVSSRQSAWQSHWLSKGAEQARDVLKCVWCRQSFQSLSALTVHMKEAKHCGVQGMPQGQVPVSVAISTSQSSQQQSSTVQSTSNMSGNQGGAPGGSGNTSSGNQQGGKDLSLLIKETMPLPRKLVRGQDVWLGKGAEQTRQILKCMWCGQSFRSLAEMTSHMQQTQHYTNIVSQEQIISWKSADDRGGSGGTGGSGGGTGGGGAGGNSNSNTTGGSSGNAGSQGGHVTAVLTCKVCDEAFGSLKELSNHMVKNAHYKEHIMRSITEGGAAGQLGNSAQARRRGGSGTGNSASAIAAREKRKKSLPVRKLLELERAQNELKNGGGDGKSGNMAMLANPGGGRITCEKCGERIETAMFVEHIRQCVGGNVTSLNQQRNLLKSALMSEVQEAAAAAAAAGARTPDGSTLPPPQRPNLKISTPDKSENTGSSKGDNPLGSGGLPGSSPSVLNAIEKLIEKSFDSRMRQGYAGGMAAGGTGNIAPGTQPIGSSILKRLGIDETVDYTKPLVDPHTMNLLRGYHAYGQFGGLLNPVAQSGTAGKRERSGSESSSVSDRCGGGGSVTPPERRQKSLTPRSTPEALQSPPVSTPSAVNQANSTPPTSQPATPITSEEKREKKDDVVSSEDEPDKEISTNVSAEGEKTCEEEENRTQEVKDSVKVDSRDTDKESDPEVKKEVEEEVNSERDPEEAEGEQDNEEHTEKTVPEDKDEPRTPKSSKSSEDRSKVDIKTEGNQEVKVEVDGEKDDDSSKGSPKAQAAGSLGALSSMFDSLSGDNQSGGQATSSGSATGVTTSHPLAALQKLCDKTESHHNHSGSAGHQSVLARSPSVGSTSSTLNANYPSSSNTSPSNPGAILAFSWACNDAVVSDSLLKCAFCETPFVSKGAYRHHLSKMHFVKDGQLPEPSPQGSGSGGQSAQDVGNSSTGGRNEVSSPKNQASAGGSTGPESRSPQVSTTPPGTSSSDESPHSKFLKYTELAKQLSSKYV